MSDPKKKYSARFLWNIGNFLIGLIVAGTPLIIYGIITLKKLYRLFPDTSDDGYLFLPMFVVVIGIVAAWIRVSNWWIKWAFEVVKDDELFLLEAKVTNKEKSFVIKTWKQLHPLQKLLRVGAFFILLGGAIYGDYIRTESKGMLANDYSWAEVKIDTIEKGYSNKDNHVTAAYTYLVDSVKYQDGKKLKSGYFVKIAEINGFTIQENDVFKLKYANTDPSNHTIDFHKPVGDTESRYLDMVKAALRSENKDSVYCKCVVDSVYSAFGLPGIAIMHNKANSYWKNESYNTIKYRLLTKQAKYKQIIQNCAQRP